MENQCSTCYYFCGHCDCSETGDCYRYPPTANLNPIGWSMYPRVKSGSWCGEWRLNVITPESDEDLFCQQCEFCGPVITGLTETDTDSTDTDSTKVFSDLVDSAHKAVTSDNPQDTIDFSDALGDLVVAISRIDQFMKRNPDVRIKFRQVGEVGSRSFLEAEVTTIQSKQYVCGITAHFFEKLLLRLSKKLIQIEETLTEDWYIKG